MKWVESKATSAKLSGHVNIYYTTIRQPRYKRRRACRHLSRYAQDSRRRNSQWAAVEGSGAVGTRAREDRGDGYVESEAFHDRLTQRDRERERM